MAARLRFYAQQGDEKRKPHKNDYYWTPLHKGWAAIHSSSLSIRGSGTM